MNEGNILDEIAFDAEADVISTRVWSFSKDRAIEKALNRIDFKARSMRRAYRVIEECTKESPDPNSPEDGWMCLMKALLI